MIIEIKNNPDDCSTELWINTEFRASWKEVDIPEESLHVVRGMIREGIEYGQELKAKQIKKVLGV